MSSTQAETEGNFFTGDGRKTNVREIADLYRHFVGRSIPFSGRIHHIGKENYGITCNFRVTDCDELEKISTSKSYSLVLTNPIERNIKSAHCVSRPQIVSEIAVVTSDNGRFLARLKEGKLNESNSKRQSLEIWDRSKLLRTICIDELEEHGPINKDSHFASMQWSPFGEQDKLLYVCQAKRPKYQSFFKQQVNNAGNGKQLNVGNDNVKCEDWGERLVGIEHTIVAILDVKDLKITTIDVEGYSLSSANWLDEGKKIVSVAYAEWPRRLGPIYCNNKPSKLVVYNLPDKSSFDIATEGQSLHSARVSHCGKKIVYLSNPSYGAHQHSVSMNLYDLSTRSSQELANGIFILDLPKRCFSLDDNKFFFVKRDYIHNQMCVINFKTKSISTIQFPTNGLDILDVYHDLILAYGAEVNKSPSLYVASLAKCDSYHSINWHIIEIGNHNEEINYETYKIDTLDKSTFISSILVSPNLKLLYNSEHKVLKDDTKIGKLECCDSLPTVIYIHGGPHSSFVDDYMPIPMIFAFLGLKTLLINYRGSIGVDENYVKSLCGKIGSLDVGDCLQIIRHFVDNKTIDPNKLIIFGGSHSGFIACHLSCQDEFKFLSAIIRNPVVDLVANFSTTDIPEWIVTEGLGYENFDYARSLNIEELLKLYECSPNATKVKNVPTLMMLGSNDRRVQMFQGERWIDQLKARGIETKCKIYPDFHDLAKPETATDSAITAILWILQHLDTL